MSQKSNHAAKPHKWIAGFAHWGQSSIYYLCEEEEWDGKLRVNGHPAIEVSDYMAPDMAARIVEMHNQENDDTMSEPETTAPADILSRLSAYGELGDLPSLAIHPQMPGFSTGRLLGDIQSAAAEIERLRTALEQFARQPGSMRGWDEGTTEKFPIERCWAAWAALTGKPA